MSDQAAVDALEGFVKNLDEALERLDEDRMRHQDALSSIEADRDELWSRRGDVLKSIERLKRPPGILSGGVMDISGTGFIGKS